MLLKVISHRKEGERGGREKAEISLAESQASGQCTRTILPRVCSPPPAPSSASSSSSFSTLAGPLWVVLKRVKAPLLVHGRLAFSTLVSYISFRGLFFFFFLFFLCHFLTQGWFDSGRENCRDFGRKKKSRRVKQEEEHGEGGWWRRKEFMILRR